MGLTYKVSFAQRAKGIIILVTTCDKSIGSGISNKKCYELKNLEDDDCWHLFKGVAFGEVIDENCVEMWR